MAEQKPRAILYVRRSSDQQHGSMPDQVRWGIEKAKHEGLDLRVSEQMLDEALKRGVNEIEDLYLDDAMTGANLDRSGLIRMQRRMREDQDIGALLVWNRDRIARPDRATDGMDIEYEIRDLGKWIIFSDSRVGPREIGQETTGDDIKAFIDYEGARKLRVNLAKNVCRSRKPNVEGGYWNGGAPPYGFERVVINLITKQIDIVPPRERRSGRELKHAVRPGTDPESLQKLEVVRWIFQWYEEGYGINAIAVRLNSLGIPSPRAGLVRKADPVRGRWNAGTVRDILEQPLFAGLMAYGRAPEGSIVRVDRHSPEGYRSLRREERGPSTVKAKKTVGRDSSTWWLVTPAIPYKPIVSEEVWRRCLERLSERGKEGKQRGLPRSPDREKYPLRIVCADCGLRMSGTPVGPRLSYICSSYTNSGGKECHHNFVERDIVVYYALAAIKRRIQAVQAEGALRDAVRSVIDETREQSSSIQLEVQAKEAALRRAEALARKAYDTMLRVDDPLQEEHAKAAYEGLLREQRAAKHALAALREATSLSTVDPEVEVDAVMAEFRDLDALVSKKQASNLRPFFDRLGAEMVVTFERREVGRRRTVPVHVELRLDPASLPLDQPPGGPQDSLGIGRCRSPRPTPDSTRIRVRHHERMRARICQRVDRTGTRAP
ncbi:MAG: recombinase family protein [Planctomycetes bacterium]|nr:recombinase family protein [Planctomycetota bacterium]